MVGLFGIIGAVTGSFFGGWIAVGIGWAVGRVIDSALEESPKPHFQRPELRTQKSVYGTILPKLFGSGYRLAGVVTWIESQGIHQIGKIKVGEEKGFLGFGSKDIKIPRWGVSFQCVFCETVDAVQQIFLDGKLYYDKGPLATSTLIERSDFLVSNGWINIMLGGAGQSPDSTMESDLGVGNVPSYLGVTGIVFTNLDLTQFGNRIPKVEIVPIPNATATVKEWIEIEPTNYWSGRERAGCCVYNNEIYIMGGLNAGGTLSDVWSSPDGLNWTQKPSMNYPRESFTPIVVNGEIVVIGGVDDGGIINTNGKMIETFDGNSWTIETGFDITSSTNPFPRDSYGMVITDTEIYLVAGENDSGHTADIWKSSGFNFKYWTREKETMLAGQRFDHRLTYFLGNIYMFGGQSPGPTPGYQSNKVWIYDSNDREFDELSDDFVNESENPGAAFPYDNDAGWGFTQWNDKLVAFLDGASNRTSSNTKWETYESTNGVTWTLLELANTPDNFDSLAYPCVNAFNQSMFIQGGTESSVPLDTIFKSTLDSVVGTSENLSDVIEELANRNGVIDSKINTTLITGSVDGLAVLDESFRQIFSTRLGPAFQVESVESDFKIKFVHRGGASVVTIPEIDLGVSRPGQGKQDWFRITRLDDLELPNSVVVNFIDANRQYQENSISKQRINTNYPQFDQDNLPQGLRSVESTIDMVLTPTQAAKTAHILLYDPWITRNKVEFTLSDKYIYLEPTDVVTVEFDGDSYLVRITSINYERPGLMRVTGVLENTEIYDHIPTTQADISITVNPEDTLIQSSSTHLFLDIPILSPYHDDWGFYFACCPSDSSIPLEKWPGCELWVQADSESFFQLLTTISIPTVMGVTTGVLNSPVLFGVLDKSNSVDVLLNHPDMSLSNVTLGELYNFGNLCLIGDEIIQFQNVVDNGNRSFTLSGLVRGKYGTEFTAGLHVNGERFCMLGTIQRIPMDYFTINQTVNYRVVTVGNLYQSISSTQFTNNGIGKRPLAVGNVRAYFDNDANWIFQFTRRVRGGNEWVDSSRNDPLREETETYEIITKDPNLIWPDSTYQLEWDSVRGSIPTFTWSLTDQLIDIATSPFNPWIEIYQVGIPYGRGIVREYQE